MLVVVASYVLCRVTQRARRLVKVNDVTTATLDSIASAQNAACALYAATLADSISTQIDMLAVDVQSQYRSVRDLADCAASNRAAYALAECASELRDIDAYRETLAALRIDFCERHDDCDVDCAVDYDERAHILSTRARSEINERCDVIARRLTTIEQTCCDAMLCAQSRAQHSERDALRSH